MLIRFPVKCKTADYCNRLLRYIIRGKMMSYFGRFGFLTPLREFIIYYLKLFVKHF